MWFYPLLTLVLWTDTVLSTFSAPLQALSKVSAGWYAGWHAPDGFPISKVPWSKYSHLVYAFAETTSDVRTLDINGSFPSVLPQFVLEAHNRGVKALISIGGATGSVYWSAIVSTDEQRTVLMKTVIDFVQKYQLDGVNFDWEYPNNFGYGGNEHSPSDSANFLCFLQKLRQDPVGKTLILSAATYIAPFNGPNGYPLSNVADFSEVLDWIVIMNYDIWGPWNSNVGPNAPLDDSCVTPNHQQGSATSALKKWTQAGFPKDQIVLGVPGYGHSFKVNKADAYEKNSGSADLATYPPNDSSSQPMGDSWGGSAGTFNMWGLIKNGYLNESGSVKDGMSYRYDMCSKTAYIYNPKTEVMISFDDVQSFAAKGSFIKANGLKGWAMWEVGSDYNDLLIDSIQGAIENETFHPII